MKANHLHMNTPSLLDTDTLWTIFGFIGTNWNNASSCAMTQAQFVDVVNWQAQLDPRYTGYYADAVSEYNSFLSLYGGNQQEALVALYSANLAPQPNPQPNPNPVVGQYVLFEFMRWQVAFGGFKAFGYVNYTGWMGGGSFLSDPPPYRALSTQSSKL